MQDIRCHCEQRQYKNIPGKPRKATRLICAGKQDIIMRFIGEPWEKE